MRFTKMHALGNDYVYVETFTQKPCEGYSYDIPALARFVSHRRYGIGSDGLVLIAPSDKADLRMIMYNLDGTEAQMCGNALRSVGKYAYTRGLVTSTEFTVETASGVKDLSVTLDSSGKVISVRANIGEPVFDEAIKLSEVTIAGRSFKISAASVGNPHCVTFIDDVDTLDIEKYGSPLEVHSLFPEKTNVEFARVIDRSTVKMRVWERGCGETWACGSGSCATAAVGISLGLIDHRVSVVQKGGTLIVEWNRDGNGIWLESDAEFVFDGTLDESAPERYERIYANAPDRFAQLI